MAACHIARSLSMCCRRRAIALKSSTRVATSPGEFSSTLARAPRSPPASARTLSTSEFSGDRMRWARRNEAAMASASPVRITPTIHASSGPVGSQLSGSSALPGKNSTSTAYSSHDDRIIITMTPITISDIETMMWRLSPERRREGISDRPSAGSRRHARWLGR
ncbi:hypothetical protein AR276_09195 [Stenotrophomonas maltophilia]|nr:hypothetical protein AR276_09195 [Stenotrophomonas maltophilia]